jgi:hypothetical protein
MILVCAIPDVIGIEILSFWLVLTTIRNLDTAMCNKSDRFFLLSLLSKETLVIHHIYTEQINFEIKYFKWVQLRGVQLASLFLHPEIKEQIFFNGKFLPTIKRSAIKSFAISKLTLDLLSLVGLVELFNTLTNLENCTLKTKMHTFNMEIFDLVDTQIWAHIKYFTMKMNFNEMFSTKMFNNFGKLISFSFQQEYFHSVPISEISLITLIRNNPNLINFTISYGSFSENIIDLIVEHLQNIVSINVYKNYNFISLSAFTNVINCCPSLKEITFRHKDVPPPFSLEFKYNRSNNGVISVSFHEENQHLVSHHHTYNNDFQKFVRTIRNIDELTFYVTPLLTTESLLMLLKYSPKLKKLSYPWYEWNNEASSMTIKDIQLLLSISKELTCLTCSIFTHDDILELFTSQNNVTHVIFDQNEYLTTETVLTILEMNTNLHHITCEDCELLIDKNIIQEFIIQNNKDVKIEVNSSRDML